MNIIESKQYTMTLSFIELMSLVSIVCNLRDDYIPDEDTQNIINEITSCARRFDP